jgi:hypothetical protein
MTEYRSIAYCQAGHAVAARLRTDCPIDTVTIPPGEPSVSALVREHLLCYQRREVDGKPPI